MRTPPVDKALHYYERFDRNLRGQLRELITDEVIAEYQANPLGERPQSEPLRRLLNYFRRAPQAGKYVVVAVEPWRDYRIGILSGARGVLPKVLDEPVFASEQDALHGVFLARIRDLRES
ncbi:MAG: inner-membrane translocator [Candidatus Binatia bacterium]